MKYMITDDTALARKMLAKKLEDFMVDGDEIIFAANGQEAVDIYKEQKPDICFMDLTMPIMDGFEATKQILEFNSDANVIVVSADMQKLAKEKALNFGAIGFITKPINEEHLKLIIAKVVKLMIAKIGKLNG